MKLVGKIFAAILSIIYSVVLFIMLLLLFVANIFSGNYYTKVLNDTNLSEIKLTDVGITSYNEELGEDATLEDALVVSLKEVGISENDARKIVNNEKVNEVVGTFIGDTMNYLTNNEEVPQLDYQDVKNIIESEEVSSVLNYTPTDRELKEFVAELNKDLAESFEEGVDYNE